MRAVLRVLRIFLIAYLGVIFVLLLIENRLVYIPTHYTEEWLSPPNERVRDIELTSADGTRIHAWWCPTENWSPEQGATLNCHGNAGNLSHRAGSIARWQKELNQAVLIFDYPGYGKSKGAPSEAGCYAAADAAYDWLVNEQKVPAERILLYGGSLGGGVAVDLASRRAHRGMVLVSTFTSVPDVGQGRLPFLPIRWLARNRFDSLSKIDRCTKPIFIFHGTADRVVPYAHGERLFAAVKDAKEFFRLEGHDHDHTPTVEFYERVRAFFERCEAEQGATSAVR